MGQVLRLTLKATLEAVVKRRRLFIALMLMPLGFFFVHGAVIVADGLIDEPGKADLIVVLGNKVEDDGRPSPSLQARLDKAADLYFAGRGRLIFASGGMCLNGFDQARVMKAYLVSRGVPAEAVIADSQGHHTWHTAKNASAYMRDHHLTSAVVVTQHFHVPRSRMSMKRFGVKPVYSVHADFFEWRDPYSIAREVAGYWVYRWFRPWPQ